MSDNTGILIKHMPPITVKAHNPSLLFTYARFFGNPISIRMLTSVDMFSFSVKSLDILEIMETDDQEH